MPRLPWRRPNRLPDDGAGPFVFPPGFLWGTATSDHQIEHAQPDQWTAFERAARAAGKQQRDAHGAVVPGHIAGIADVDDAVIARKADFDRHFDADLGRAKAAGHTAFRLSISWARLFPRPDLTAADDAGLAFYDRVFDAIDAHGLKASVTLFHFAIPAWLDVAIPGGDGRRGLERSDAVHAFARFADVVARRYAPRVKYWCTLNEPMVYAYLGYLEGVFPPNERRGSPKDVAFLGAQLLRMHVAGYQALKAVRTDTDVCIATHVRRFMPARNHWPLDVATEYFVDRAFILDFVDAIDSGVWRPTQTGIVEVIPGLRGSQDSIGLNYYGRSYVRTGLVPGRYRVTHHDPDEPGEDVSDLGWALDERSFADELVRFHQRYHKPIQVLENGIADSADDDVNRQRFIVRHTQAMWHAMHHHGVDCRGYFYWSLIDNFEWAEGFNDGRFGLYRVDFGGDDDQSSFARVPRGSVDVYGAIARHNAIPADLWATHRRPR